MICLVCQEKLNLGGKCARCGADYGTVNIELLRVVGRFELRIAELLARLVEADPHVHGPRPCASCKTISGLLDRPFGCQKRRL
jgi:hypothetical protein